MPTFPDIDFSSPRAATRGAAEILESPADDPAPQSIHLACGASASIAGPPDAERLQVFSEAGQLVFEYDPVARRTRLHVATGDLQLVAGDGRIDLVARDGIRLRSGATVDVESQFGVRLEAGRSSADGRSALHVQPRTAQLIAPHVRLSAAQLDARAADLQVSSASFTGRIRRARLVAGALETVVGTLVASASTIVSRVAGLFQMRAANVHVAVDENVQVQGERVVVKAVDDAKILGEQIHLG